jgi:hypothetical protein
MASGNGRDRIPDSQPRPSQLARILKLAHGGADEQEVFKRRTAAVQYAIQARVRVRRIRRHQG